MGGQLILAVLTGTSLILPKCHSTPQPPNQALLLTFSHCDKASPIIRSFYQELPCHGHLSLYIKGVMGVLLWMNGPGVGEGGSRQRLPWQQDLCRWPELGNVKKMVKYCRRKCSACHLKGLVQRKKTKKLCQKKNRKTRY